MRRSMTMTPDDKAKISEDDLRELRRLLEELEAELQLSRFVDKTTGRQAAALRRVLAAVDPEPTPLEKAQKSRTCRICGQPMSAAPGNPFVFNYGKEFAHQKCLDNESKPPAPSVVDTDPSFQAAIKTTIDSGIADRVISDVCPSCGQPWDAHEAFSRCPPKKGGDK